MSERSVLLLSGGLDSTALAALHRPAQCVVVDYGQRCATAETQAATAVAKALRLPVRTLAIDLRDIGAGLLHSDEPIAGAPSREWWPYRNQLLVTVAAAVALREHLDTVLIGSVRSDGARHVDGTTAFYESLDQLVSMQEGSIRVCAPALHDTTAELITRSGLGEDVLGWTVSCHRANFPCGTCPGCHKRTEVLAQVGILCGASQHESM
ncbi:7-cyano-7-deazaguanine synthase [Mycolicibacterium llatzerense]|uniref:7-cyano-7-deazaguanine synthase n=1 Tax=Mycolicibacterium llatzerense TaxID=280871 RepID=UPI00366D3078